MDFNRGFLELVANNPEDSVTKCAKQSYKTNLGIHHPYTIRQAASLAMHTMSGRTLFIPKLIGKRGPRLSFRILICKNIFPLLFYFSH